MPDHTVTAFDEELNGLKRKIAEMGGIAEKMVGDAMLALQRRDTDLAQAVRASDERLDTLQREIEESAILTIARRQPMAVDLRDVVAVIRIASDLERVGDLAKNICKRVMVIEGNAAGSKGVVGLMHLSRLVLTQLKQVLDSYTARSDENAREVWQRDTEVDAFYTSIFRELLTYMMEDTRNITYSTHLLFTAKNLERIGDHATNIAETVHYLVTGSTMPLDRPRGGGATAALAETAAR